MLSVCRGKVSKREAISGSSSSLLGKQRFIRRKLHVLPRFDTLVVRPDHHLNPRIRDEKARDDTRETDRRCRYVSFLARIKPCHLSIRSHHSKWKSNCMEKGSCCCCCCENFLRSNSFDGRGEDKLERKIKLLGSKLIHLGIMQMQIILLPSFLFSTILFYFKIELWQTYIIPFSHASKKHLNSVRTAFDFDSSGIVCIELGVYRVCDRWCVIWTRTARFYPSFTRIIMDPRQIRDIIYAPIGSGSRSGSVIAVAHVTPSRTMLPFLSISRNCYNNKKERAREPWRGVLRSHHLHALIKELPHLRARKFVIHDSRSSCATKYLYSRLRSHCERKLNFPWTTMILNRRGGGEWSGEGRGNFVEESRMVAKRRINSSKWLFNEPKCLTQIPSRITRRDPVDDAVSRQRFPKRTVTPWLTRLVKASRCSTNTWTGSRSVFPFFFFSTGARTGTVCRGKRFSHVNIVENRTML